MNTSLIYWVDKNIGRPVCLFLSVYRKIKNLFHPETLDSHGISRLLFIKLIEQGSTVLAYPVLKKAVEKLGKKNVYFMVFQENREILDILNIIEPANIIEVESKSLITFITSVLKALGKIRKERIDAVIDMEFFSRASAILAFLSGANKRVGVHRFTAEAPYRGDLFNYRLSYNPYIHTSQWVICMFNALIYGSYNNKEPLIFEIPELSHPPQISVSDEEKSRMINMVEEIKGAPITKPIIIFNPNASDMLPIRRWPEEYFIILSEKIRKEFPKATIIISGAPSEKKRAEIMASKIEGAVSLAGRTSLKDLMALFFISDLLITNDSGPGHFASLTPIKSIIMFGPETPLLYGSLSPYADIMYKKFVCSPCVSVYNHRKSPCNSGKCMKAITPEEVFKKVKSLLSDV